jgi:hypothetical protein
MRLIKTIIHRLGDPPVEELKGLESENANPSHFIILEGGMASGKTSVMLIAKTDAGQQVSIQLSAEMFDTLNSAVKGANQHFKENP